MVRRPFDLGSGDAAQGNEQHRPFIANGGPGTSTYHVAVASRESAILTLWAGDTIGLVEVRSVFIRFAVFEMVSEHCIAKTGIGRLSNRERATHESGKSLRAYVASFSHKDGTRSSLSRRRHRRSACQRTKSSVVSYAVVLVAGAHVSRA